VLCTFAFCLSRKLRCARDGLEMLYALYDEICLPMLPPVVAFRWFRRGHEIEEAHF
jgi:hypothetical protein